MEDGMSPKIAPAPEPAIEFQPRKSMHSVGIVVGLPTPLYLPLILISSLPLGLDEILQIWSIATGKMQRFGPRPFIGKQINDQYIRSVLSYTKPGFVNSRSIATGIGNRALQGGLASDLLTARVPLVIIIVRGGAVW